jgi:hypothetical protein
MLQSSRVPILALVMWTRLLHLLIFGININILSLTCGKAKTFYALSRMVALYNWTRLLSTTAIDQFPHMSLVLTSFCRTIPFKGYWPDVSVRWHGKFHPLRFDPYEARYAPDIFCWYFLITSVICLHLNCTDWRPQNRSQTTFVLAADECTAFEFIWSEKKILQEVWFQIHLSLSLGLTVD